MAVGQICIILAILVQPELITFAPKAVSVRILILLRHNLVLPDEASKAPSAGWSSGRKFQSQAMMRQNRLWRNLCQGP
jgi:hypothetical protein